LSEDFEVTIKQWSFSISQKANKAKFKANKLNDTCREDDAMDASKSFFLLEIRERKNTARESHFKDQS
jgi:hypothetical protein